MTTNFVSTGEDVSLLYHNHHQWLYGWLRHKLGNSCDAADLAHDTFVRVITRQDALHVREPRPYLSTIARGLVTDLFRRRRLEHAYLEAVAQLPEVQVPSAESRAIVLETLFAIDTMLDGMKPVVRQAFLMSQLEGMTYAEIASKLHVTKRTVGNYMCVALEHCYVLDA